MPVVWEREKSVAGNWVSGGSRWVNSVMHWRWKGWGTDSRVRRKLQQSQKRVGSWKVQWGEFRKEKAVINSVTHWGGGWQPFWLQLWWQSVLTSQSHWYQWTVRDNFPAFFKKMIYSFIFGLASLIAQLVKKLPAMQETPVRLLGQEDPVEKG